MKYTLLDLTQTILSSMDSDEVNSISDTPESLQVATCIRSTYFDIINRANLEEHYSLITLNASGDGSKPTLMTMPTTVADLQWLKYDCATVDDPEINMQDLTYIEPKEFLDRMYSLDESETNVGTFIHTFDNGDEVKFLYTNDNAPSTYTVFDDYTFIFDSYDAAMDSTLQKAKTLGRARNTINWSMTDSFIPDLDETQFPLLLNEAKSLAWLELKQLPHQKAEVFARRGWTSVQKNKINTSDERDFDRLPYFGRR